MSHDRPVTASLKPARRLSLKAGFLWSFIGNMIVVLCQALLTKVTSFEDMGRFVIAQGLCIPVFMFANLDLRLLQATDDKNEFRFAECLALRILAGLLALLVIPLAGLLSGYDTLTMGVIVVVAFGKFFEQISDACHAVMQKAERLDRVTLSQVLHGVLSSTLLGLVVWQTGSLIAGVIAGTLSHLALLLLFDIPVASLLRSERSTVESFLSLRELRQVRAARLFQLTRFGLPLAFRSLLTSLNAQAPRLLVERFFGLAATGIFGPISMGITAATTVSRALNQASATRLGKLAAQPNRARFRRFMLQLQLLYLGLGIVAIAVAAAIGDKLLAIVFRPEYAQHQTVLVLVAAAVAVQYHNGVLDLGLVALRRTRLLAATSFLSLAVTGTACWLLIPQYGLIGAGLAMIGSRTVRSAILLPILLRHSRDDVSVDDSIHDFEFSFTTLTALSTSNETPIDTPGKVALPSSSDEAAVVSTDSADSASDSHSGSNFDRRVA